MKHGLLFIPFLKGYGGTETVINNLLGQMDISKQQDVSIKTYSIGGSEDYSWLDHNNVHCIKYPNYRLFREILYIFSLPFILSYFIITNRPNFIISTNPIMWFLSKLTVSVFRMKVPVIAWYHYSYKLKPVKNIFLKSPDYYFTISESGKKELENLDIQSNKIRVVYNPVLPSDKVINHSDNYSVFLYVGRTEYEGQKNISELFYALSKLPDRKWTLLNYGIGPDKDSLVRLSKELGIYSNIQWMGFKRNVFDHIKEADSLILTSKYEGFPMVLIEAIAHGLFVISSDCQTGPAEVVNDDNGFLYNMGDFKELSTIIYNVQQGKYDINPKQIKASISHLYIDHYFEHFIRNLDQLSE
jgi:UDP-D-galactose:(glucosyl)LPS alpha-1,6-D-galactosyltransferase